MDHFDSPLELVEARKPELPVACVRPQRLRTAARWFVDNFPGTVYYAVKANPSSWALSSLNAGGVTAFDVASDNEVRVALTHVTAEHLAFMNPVKSRRSIASAYHDHGVRIFAYDCAAELNKILEETGNAKDLTLVLRMAVDNKSSALPLAGKFGATPFDSEPLMQDGRRLGERFGVSFHVGSQCMDPYSYANAMHQVAAQLRKAGVTIDVMNVGGGFPAIYPGMNPPPMDEYIRIIQETRSDMPLLGTGELWCEPGRALVAEAVSVVARVELRKGNALFLNDGAFGNLFDAAHARWLFPVRRLSQKDDAEAELMDYRFFGPTCDSMDVMPGPFHLPVDMEEGEYIEIGMLGAYGTTLSTNFNGFGETELVTVRDAPWTSLFPTNAREDNATDEDAPRYIRRRRGRGVGEAGAR
jgi:ornithine decarboxylase